MPGSVALVPRAAACAARTNDAAARHVCGLAALLSERVKLLDGELKRQRALLRDVTAARDSLQEDMLQVKAAKKKSDSVSAPVERRVLAAAAAAATWRMPATHTHRARTPPHTPSHTHRAGRRRGSRPPAFRQTWPSSRQRPQTRSPSATQLATAPRRSRPTWTQHHAQPPTRTHGSPARRRRWRTPGASCRTRSRRRRRRRLSSVTAGFS